MLFQAASGKRKVTALAVHELKKVQAQKMCRLRKEQDYCDTCCRRGKETSVYSVSLRGSETRSCTGERGLGYTENGNTSRQRM